MYDYKGDIINDLPGSMSGGEAPSPDYVSDMLTTMYKTAGKLEEMHKLLSGVKDTDGEVEILTTLSEVSDVLDTIDKIALRDVALAYGLGALYSSAECWIMSAMYDLVGREGVKSDNAPQSILDIFEKMMDDGEPVPPAELKSLSAELYNCIAAIYLELYNTYELDRWVDDSSDRIKDITRGFNEFLMSNNLGIEEISKFVYEKTQEFVFVTNEVDRDPEVGKKIRDMVPTDLVFDFESVIDLITAEQVEDILNGKIKIDADFIMKVSSESDDE